MSNSKTKKIVSIAALALCLALAATFVLAFTACDEENASASSEVTPAVAAGFVSAGSYTINSHGEIEYDEPPVTADSEIIEATYVENENVMRTSDFDVNGVAECISYNHDGYYMYDGDASHYINDGCSICDGDCKGHDWYLTVGGGAYYYYPYSYTLAPVSMTAETAEIQVSIIFKKEPAIKGKYFDSLPYDIEVSSLTGEALEIASITSREMLVYRGFDEDGNQIVWDASVYSTDIANRKEFGAYANPTDTVKIYENAFSTISYSVLSIELANGDAYAYGFSNLASWDFELITDDNEKEKTDEGIYTDDE